ncbi:MAG: hypothetical protein IKU26_03215 [Clostridia bacterium]|nr:hypothetical protein [Clostridia bacterium]
MEKFSTGCMLPMELLKRTNESQGLIDFACRDMARKLAEKMLDEIQKEECVCTLSKVKQTEWPMQNTIEFRQTVTIERLVRCADCRFSEYLGDNALVCNMHFRMGVLSNGFCSDAKPRREAVDD